MKAFREFSIPIKGLSIGLTEFDFKIDNQFFESFEESPIQEGKFDVKCYLDKRSDMLIFTFDFKGSFKTECDRCLANIDLPISENGDLIVKYAEQPEEDGEVVYIVRETSEFNVAKYIYEYICLSMPVTNIYDCEEEEETVCDLKMLAYLDQKEDETEEENSSNPFKDAFKDFNKNNPP